MTTGDLWVFGYGSLMWDPGFAFADRQIATLDGFARRFCMDSIHYRGTEEDPGLVLALDQEAGAECHGTAFRVVPAEREQVLSYLRERELISSAYLERWLDIRLTSGPTVNAVTYVINRDHRQYAVGKTLTDQAAVIAHAHGARGPNRDYLANTVAQLAELDIADPELEELHRLVQAIPSKTNGK